MKSQTSSPPHRVQRSGACPDAWRIEVFKRASRTDPDGEAAREEARELGFEGVEEVRIGRGYLLEPSLPAALVARMVAEFFADPVLDEARVFAPGERPAAPADHARLLVARKPGVMDSVALSVAAALARNGLLSESPAAAGSGDGPPVRVQTFTAYELRGSLSGDDLAALGRLAFANEVIEDLYVGREDIAFAAPAAERPPDPASVALTAADDDELLRISQDGALSLSLAEMHAIRAHYVALGREPTPAELETLAQTWSEHCKHKTFAGRVRFGERAYENLFKETIVRATRELDRDWCVSVFHDNAGIVAFADGWDLCFKVETHNHPSAIDPYGGAGTGIGGVIRDILGCGRGALPIANIDAFFVGPQDLPEERLPEGTLHPRRILRGVVKGVADYGNRMGIPTVAGGVWFDEGYVANPLVYCGTVGILPRDCATKSVAPGDAIVVVGGRTGRDGIHGATFSSIELSEDSGMVSAAAVQIGDPITEKRVLDGLLVARDRGLYRGITDCGAGGLSSAVGEMGEKCGAEVWLERVPLKYPGLTPAEIWISEAQERMVLAVPPTDVEELLAVFAAEDCEATVIGRFTDTGRLVLRHGDQTVGELEMGFLHDGAPRPERQAAWDPPQQADPGAPHPASAGGAAGADAYRTLLERLLAHPDVQSKEWIIRRYDHEVQGHAVCKPLVGPRGDGPGDGSVLAPLASTTRGFALGLGANPRLGALDPYAMALAVVDEALRNVVAAGGDPDRTALLDNFSWGNCERPQVLGALVLAAEGCKDAALAHRTPFVSGKDSLNNEYKVGEQRIAIPPTLLISALAIVPDVRMAVTMDAKQAGDALFLVGPTTADLGGSLYLAELGLGGGRVPRPDLERAPALFAKLHAEIAAGRVRACHDLAEGGLAVAAAELAFAGELGLDLELAPIAVEGLPAPADPAVDPAFDVDALRLFGESCSRFLVEVLPEDADSFARALGADAVRIGTVSAAPRLAVTLATGERFELPNERARAAHAGPYHP